MNTLSEEEQPSTSTVTGPIWPETLCAEIASHIAIASPKNKEELVRQFKFNPEVDTRLEQQQHRLLGLRSRTQPRGDSARITVKIAEPRHFGDEMSAGLVQECQTAVVGVDLELRPEVRNKVFLTIAPHGESCPTTMPRRD